MIDNLARDLQLLQRADWLITKMWVNVAARHFGLFAFAGLVAVFGLGMMNVAGFYALQVVWGPVWAAAAVGIADFILASVVMLFGRNIEPGPELELALDVRKMAVAAIETERKSSNPPWIRSARESGALRTLSQVCLSILSIQRQRSFSFQRRCR